MDGARIAKNLVSAGGAAVSALMFVHPIDVVKTRLQCVGEAGKSGTQYTGAASVMRRIIYEEGATSFYKGIRPAIMREASYASLRIGLYAPIKSAIGADKPDASGLRRFVAGALAGLVGCFAGNPFDMLKTRMMAYEGTEARSLGTFVKEIYQHNGVTGFYKGVQANMIRAMANNATNMAVYDNCKDGLKNAGMKDGVALQFMSAFTTGFFMTCVVGPFDILRTRLMNQPSDVKLYNGIADCATKIYKNEGLLAFYRGFFPIWGRFAPAVTL